MTFEGMNNAAPVTPVTPNSNGSYPVLPVSPAAPTMAQATLPLANEVIVKAFFGNDIRRASFSGGYANLHEVLIKIYGFDPATTILKYQDDDGDKITMSTDAELREALKLMKDTVLRVYVETKAAPAVPQQEGEAWGNRWRYGPMRGHHRGGFGGGGRRGGWGPFPHGPMGPHGSHPHPSPFFGGHPHPHPHPHHHEVPHADPVQTTHIDHQQQDGSNAHHTTLRTHAHGHFSPADPAMSHCKGARADASPYPRGDWKERKHAMKEHFKYMKENSCVDKEEFKELKQMMKEQMNLDKEEMKAAKQASKAEKYGKKDKKEKRERKEKKDKDERFVARHVADVTIPDNSELPSNAPVTKTWRLRNDGAIAWPADSQLVLISHRGDALNGPERVFVGAVEPQKDVDVSVTFVTPNEAGRYIGYYRMATGEGRKFGQRVWVSFLVALAQPTAAVAVDAQDRALDVNME